MTLAFLLLAMVLVLAGHAFRLLRWEQFVRIYERPRRGIMLRGLAGGLPSILCCPCTWAMCSGQSLWAAG